MSVDDSAANRIYGDTPLDPTDWPVVRARIAGLGPGLAAAEAERDLSARHGPLSASTHVPLPLLHLLRGGAESRRRATGVIVVRGTPVTIVLAQQGTLDPHPNREATVWRALLEVYADVASRPVGTDKRYEPHPAMPPEIAVAQWERDGETVYATGPAASRADVKIARTRRRPHMSQLALPAVLITVVTEKALAWTKVTAAGAAATVLLTASPSALRLETLADPPAHPPAVPAAPAAPQQVVDVVDDEPTSGKAIPGNSARHRKPRRKPAGSRYGVLPQQPKVPAPEGSEPPAGDDDPPASPDHTLAPPPSVQDPHEIPGILDAPEEVLPTVLPQGVQSVLPTGVDRGTARSGRLPCQGVTRCRATRSAPTPR